ncbi:MAG: lysophospholipase [Parvularculaceae bacterium]|nr:lysophospholipase [Parvularculaceae bacterium]
MTAARPLLWFLLAPILLAASACVSYPPAPPAVGRPKIEAGRLVAADGAALGLDVWPLQRPKAIVLAVHGMNDYARHFADFAAWLSAEAGVAVYAYDQRGFGRSPAFGRWVGDATLRSDLRSAVAAVRAEHPDAPLFLLGHSMGAAVILAEARESALDVDGAVLVAPAVWGGSRMPLLYRIAANVAATFAPGKTLTGERAGRRSTDNISALREMIADPKVIKATRLDAVLGVTRIMGEAWDATDEVGGRILVLTGARDEIIPPDAQDKAAGRLCGEVTRRLYAEGWHLLLRDLQAETVYRDIAAWISETALGCGAGG